MRKGLTSVKAEQFKQIGEKLGMTIVAKKGWTKFFPAGHEKGAALGVPNTAQVTRVELVGFTHETGIPHPKPPAKTVEQMLNFEQPEQMILADFNKAAKHLIETVAKADAATAAEEVTEAEVVADPVAATA
jgi:hypothetical protein